MLELYAVEFREKWNEQSERRTLGGLYLQLHHNEAWKQMYLGKRSMEKSLHIVDVLKPLIRRQLFRLAILAYI